MARGDDAVATGSAPIAKRVAITMKRQSISEAQLKKRLFCAEGGHFINVGE